MKLGIEGSIKDIEGELQAVLDKREAILKETRDSISSCSKAIIHIHTGKRREAEKEIAEAKRALLELRKKAQGNLARYLVSPEAEYVEAVSVQSIVSGRRIPAAESLGVSSEAYLLGLLDVVGELKRLLLDSMMEGETAKARKYFAEMEGLYSVLAPFAVFDHVVNGIRRKIDVARILTEDVRGIMAEEARRGNLVSSMQKLTSSLARA